MGNIILNIDILLIEDSDGIVMDFQLLKLASIIIHYISLGGNTIEHTVPVRRAMNG